VSGRDVRERLYDGTMLMFSDLPWARNALEGHRRLQAARDPLIAESYRNRADRLERAIQATEADLKDLERELANVH